MLYSLAQLRMQPEVQQANDAFWHLCAPPITNASSRIWIDKLGGDSVPGNFVLLSAETVVCATQQRETPTQRIARIIGIDPSSNGSRAVINIFHLPKQCPRSIHSTIGPLTDPSTRYMPEIIQTDIIITINASEILRYAHVYHHEVLAADLASKYLQGMEDCFVIRYRYSYKHMR